MIEPGSVVVAVTGGVLSFLSPCVLPLVPSYLTFVTGMSLEEMREGHDRARTLTYASLFVLGLTLIFVLLGASASFLGQFIRYYDVWVARIGGVVIIVLGLHMAGAFRITPLLRQWRPFSPGEPTGYLGAVAVGMAFGAGWTPCYGAVLGAILTLAGVQESLWEGVALLAAYSAGFAIPFLIAAVAVDRFIVAFARFRRFLPAVEITSGILLVLLGILLVTGSFTVLTAWLAPFTPDFLLVRI